MNARFESCFNVGAKSIVERKGRYRLFEIRCSESVDIARSMIGRRWWYLEHEGYNKPILSYD